MNKSFAKFKPNGPYKTAKKKHKPTNKSKPKQQTVNTKN